MATYINNNVKFHGFSKSPVSPDTTLGGAVNPSGHTITTSQVRAQDIPAFLNTFAGSRADAITWVEKNYATPAHNDIVFYGGEFKAGFDTPKCLKYNGKTSTWEDFDLKYEDRENEVLRTTLKNADDKDVLAIHQDCKTVFVDGGNNAATNSNRWSLFVKKSDGSILDHFVASTDKIVAGMPSLGYNALVMWNKAAIDEGELEANYVGNTFAGIIHLNKQYATGDDAKFTVTCFEYIGDKLDTTLGNIREEIQDIVGVTMEGVVASVTANDAAASAGIGVDSSVKTSPKITFTAGSVATGETKLVTGGAVKTYVDTTALAEGGSIAQAIAAAKEQAIANAKVTLTAGNGITIPNSGKQDTAFTVSVDTDVIATKKSVDDLSGIVSGLPATIEAAKAAADAAMAEAQAKVASVSGPATGLVTVTGDKEVTITVSDTIATKTDAATAAANAVTTGLATGGNIAQAIATAKSGAEQTAATALSTARGEITTEISTAVSGLETKLTTGEGSLGAKVAALETATGTTLPAAIEQALEDAKAYSDSLHTTSLDYVVLGDSETLPTASADTLGKIYLVASQNAPTADGAAISGSYVEYMTRKVSETEYTWEKIGTTAADLSGYAKSVKINGQTYNATVANAGAIDLGSVVTNVSWDNTAADNPANAGNSTYATISSAGVLYLSIASATSTTKGISKVFSGNYWELPSGVDQTSTAVGTDTASKMFSNIGTRINQVSELANGKVASVTAGDGDVLTGLSVSVGGSATAPTISVTNGVINSGSLPATTKVVANGLIDGTDVIETEKINFGEGKPSDAGIFTSGANQLTTWVGDMPNLQSGYNMFASHYNLESFCGDLSSLMDGTSMFAGCTKLTSFTSDLSSLEDGNHMFNQCTLDAESLECIAETLPTVSGSPSIDIGASTNATADVIATIKGKGWTLRSNGTAL